MPLKNDGTPNAKEEDNNHSTGSIRRDRDVIVTIMVSRQHRLGLGFKAQFLLPIRDDVIDGRNIFVLMS